jgi:hypothetical protein
VWTPTRGPWILQTLAPVANGNTHNFDTGTPGRSKVNENTLNDTTLDGSTTAGQIDQYTIPVPSHPGTFAIVAVGVSARMQKGTSGPSKMDLGVRSGGTDYWSTDISLGASWATSQNWWTTDPTLPRGVDCAANQYRPEVSDLKWSPGMRPTSRRT